MLWSTAKVQRKLQKLGIFNRTGKITMAKYSNSIYQLGVNKLCQFVTKSNISKINPPKVISMFCYEYYLWRILFLAVFSLIYWNIRWWIYPATINPQFKMQMWPGRISCCPNIPNQVSSAHWIETKAKSIRFYSTCTLLPCTAGWDLGITFWKTIQMGIRCLCLPIRRRQLNYISRR